MRDVLYLTLFHKYFGKPSFDVFAAECIFRCSLTRDFYPSSYFPKLITQAHSDCLYLFPDLPTDSHINSDLGFDWSNHKYFVLKHSASCVNFDLLKCKPLPQSFTAFNGFSSWNALYSVLPQSSHKLPEPR